MACRVFGADDVRVLRRELHSGEAMKLTLIDRANKYAEMVERYYRQHDPHAKATKVAFEEYKAGYIAGWRAAMKRRRR